MPNLTVIQSNIAAALDKTSLTAADHAALREYARNRSRTAPAARNFAKPRPPSSADRDVMRALMYHRSYGDPNWPGRFSANCRKRPGGVCRIRLCAAERACPHGLPIAQWMREAGELFA